MDMTRRELFTRLFSRDTLRQIVPDPTELPSVLQPPTAPLSVEAAGRSLRRRPAAPAPPPAGEQPPHES